MAFHPPGIAVEIVGTEAGKRGCMCKEHAVNCGEVLKEDMVVHLWKVQVGKGYSVLLAIRPAICSTIFVTSCHFHMGQNVLAI
jgi:hypothetical protein